jgi:hypothetical protein
MSSDRGGRREVTTSGASGMEPLSTQCCEAGVPQNQLRGTGIVCLGGDTRSCRPRVGDRTCAPSPLQRAGMVGGVSVVSRKEMIAVWLRARQGSGVVRWLHRGTDSALGEICLGREGGLAFARRQTTRFRSPLPRGGATIITTYINMLRATRYWRAYVRPMHSLCARARQGSSRSY